MPRTTNARKGVTLIEMLVVITIISMLAGVVTVVVVKYLDRAKPKIAKQQIAAFETALQTYKVDVGSYPTTEQGLEALHTKPGDITNWDGPYLKEIPVDPWKNAYIYKYPGEHGDDPEILSYGQDGQPGGEGLNADVTSWK